jgi:hypothetical protein
MTAEPPLTLDNKPAGHCRYGKARKAEDVIGLNPAALSKKSRPQEAVTKLGPLGAGKWTVLRFFGAPFLLSPD